MEQPVSMQDFFSFLESSQKFRQLFPHQPSSKNLFQEYISEVIDEIQLQVIMWYNGESTYPKPEDILVDYTFCTPQEAHFYLPVFTECITE